MRRVLLDIDNTITKPDYIIQTMANVSGKEYTGNETLETYNIGDVFGFTKQEDKMFWELYSGQVLQNSVPNFQTIGAIYNYVIKPDDMIFIITARDEKYRSITEKWLETYNVRYDALIMVGNNSKVGFIESLGLEIIIDDKPDLFLEIDVVKDLFPNSFIATRDIKKYVVNYPYNRDIERDYTILTDGKILEGKG